jgi:uncharacterized protein
MRSNPPPQLVHARVHHARRGGARNAFTYGADYVLAPMSRRSSPCPGLFARNGFGVFALLDRDHGLGKGDAAAWARDVAREAGFSEAPGGELWLLTQPRLLGFVFNPVSFWFFTDAAGAARAVLAEVNNTAGERRAYFCQRPDHAPLRAEDRLSIDKTMYVSPFQHEAGRYDFRFDWRDEAVGVRIAFRDAAGGGLLATLEGARAPMGWGRLLLSLMRFPFGSLRVVGLIFWQALKLRLKGERFRTHVKPALGEAG